MVGDTELQKPMSLPLVPRISPGIRLTLKLAAASVLLASFLEAQNATVLEIQNLVQTNTPGGGEWSKAEKNQALAVGDRIRTRQRSRTTLALTGLYTVRLDQFTTVEITPGLVSSDKPTLDIASGAAFIFSREKEGEIDIRMPGANAALRGTQLFAQALPGGKSVVQVMEGSVELKNSSGSLVLISGEAGEAMPGQAPRKTAVIEAKSILRWALYYPAVLDPLDLNLRVTEAESLAGYRKGNLLGAVAALPESAPSETGERLYHAGVLLAVGRVDEARALLDAVPETHAGRRALDRMITAVAGREAEAWPVQEIATASEAMAESYYLQSQAKLEPAKQAALRATELSPANGYAWTRLAELEFSTGRHREAREAIEKGLALTPENARAHTLHGFILSAENRIVDARASFETAVRLDGAFGNAWLGLGLTKIKQGDLPGGRVDVQTAATVEPTSSIFHSYLAKVMSQDGRKAEAAKDLELARLLDPADPTPLLYSAIEKEQGNRINEAIGDLEQSIVLNDNRRIYRSKFLLDQDRAVRSANLARIYQNAGMKDVAVREATRAVESDYSSSSAHLFLANSFDALRDPDRVLLRYETPWFNELLLANLLAPVGGGPLSQFVSQEEYSKLLEADGSGGSLTTQVDSNSQVRTNASVFGNHGKFSYGLDYYTRKDPGERPNSEFEIQELYAQMKWQPNPDDIFYFLGKWAAQETGDNFQTFDNRPLSTKFNFEENQEPGLLLAGLNHRWSPESNTLFLLGRLSAEQILNDPLSRQLLIERDTSAMRPGLIQTGAFGFDEFTDPSFQNTIGVAADGSLIYPPALLAAITPYVGSGAVVGTGTVPVDFQTRREFEIYSTEVQHIWQTDLNTLLLGGRWQEGQIATEALLSVVQPTFAGGFAAPVADQYVESDFRRTGLYLYDYWKVLPSLTAIGGVAWDTINHPDNFRNPPVNTDQESDRNLGSKLGFTYQPAKTVTLRGIAAEGLGGLSFDESVRLEPAQLAGFNQAYRTVISESVAGSVEAPAYRIAGLSAEGVLPTRTWWGVSFNVIEQKVSRTIGAFTGYSSSVFPIEPAYFASDTAENLDYLEESLAFTLNQLLADEFAIGAGYRVTRSELQTRFPELQALAGFDFTDRAVLHEATVYGNWNSPKGFFAQVEARGYHQDLDDDSARALTRSGDDFVHFNTWGGYRFNRNLCEVSAAVHNIGDTDYQLSALSPFGNIPRQRTFSLRLRVSF